MAIYIGDTKVKTLSISSNPGTANNINYYEFDSTATYGMFLFNNPFVGEDINVSIEYDFYSISTYSQYDDTGSIRATGKLSVSVGTKTVVDHNSSAGIDYWALQDQEIYYRKKRHVSFATTLTAAKSYLQLGNWIRDMSAKYYIMNLIVKINGTPVEPFDVYVFSDRGTATIKSCFDLTQKVVKPITQKYNGKINVAFGDSITYGSGYHQKLGGILGSIPSGICYNGWTITGNIVNLLDKLAESEKENNGKIGLITMLAGVNDFNTSRPLGTIESTNQSEFYGALHKICSYIINNYPDVTFIIATPLHCNLNEFTNPNSKNSLGLKLLDYCEAIKNICVYYDIPCLDLHSVSGYIPHIEWNKTKYTADGLHPNENGKHLITKLWADFIDNLAE